MSTTATENPLLHKHAYSNIIDTTFNTPLVKLNQVAPEGSNIYVKCEFFNPLASVKDRIGKAMIETAEADGVINRDTHIIEPTSGNTGIALAFVCAAKGYKLTLTMPESMSIERRMLFKALGANLVLTPAAEGMKGAIGKAAELVATGENTWMPQQFENPANPDVHERTTGPEIWADLDGKVDAIVTGVGTGGTITGVTRCLRKHNPDFVSIAVEPSESPVITQTMEGAEIKPGPHKIQGIGAGFVPRNCDVTLLNGTFQVSSEEAFAMGRRLAKEEGIFGGISTGANVHAAIGWSQLPGNEGKVVVTTGCSFGERYLSTPLFKDE